MKKTLLLTFLLLCVTGLQAKPAAGLQKALHPASQQALLEHVNFAPSIDLNKEDKFGNTPLFAAAQKGDVRGILWMQKAAPNGEYLLHTGKDGNNVLHIARDMETFEVVLRSIRHFYPQDFKAKVAALLEQKNDLKETPLRAQLNYGKGDIFIKYFPQTRLFKQMSRVQAKLSQGGLVAEVAQDEKEAVLEKSKDLSGVTLPQAMRRMARRPGMQSAARLFQERFPSL